MAPGKFTRLLSNRPLLRAFGWLNVGLGLIGAVLPLMPTTVFLLIALWAFSKSSPELHDWLYNHPRFGPALRHWRDDRAIARPAKVAAVIALSISIFFLARSDLLPTAGLVVLIVLLTAIGAWLVTRPTPRRDGG